MPNKDQMICPSANKCKECTFGHNVPHEHRSACNKPCLQDQDAWCIPYPSQPEPVGLSLLTPEQIKELLSDYAVEICNSNPIRKWNWTVLHSRLLNAEAALWKGKIRKLFEEMEYLKETYLDDNEETTAEYIEAVEALKAEYLEGKKE